MILGIGQDMVDIRRIRDLMTRFGERFVERIFSQGEYIHAFSQSDPALSFAKRFAAKEAVAKAMGTGVRGFEFRDIEVISGPLGRPSVVLHAKAMRVLERQHGGVEGTHIHLSLTDELPYALAMAVIEGTLRGNITEV